MADNFTPRVKVILRENGCFFVRQGKGDHEIWHSPINNRRFMVDNNIKSRHWANYTLKQAGLFVLRHKYPSASFRGAGKSVLATCQRARNP